MSLTTRIVVPIARQLQRADQAVKRTGSRIGITKETVPDAVLWPFRRAAYYFVMTGSKLQSATEGLWGALTGGRR